MNIPPIKVVSDEEAEACDYVICGRWDTTPAFFPDDVKANCVACGVALRHRPYAPKKPAKLCMECAAQRMNAN